MVFHVEVDHGSVRFAAGPSRHPDVTFAQDHATAVAVGTRRAVAPSRVHGRAGSASSGDVEALTRHVDAFDGVDDVFRVGPRPTAY